MDAISSIGHNGRRDKQFIEHFYIVTVGTVHDEALLQVESTITREEIAAIKACMTNVATLDVPLKVDVEIMQRWGEGIKQED
ncbi:hypothetical protein AB4Z30_09925 [Paenibacillus sp. 2TAF8]|uniref:hypothetical protein n=1 Tax=Paenibacillus sp. 2TAF8 TaxID=3233020 RepID=UPI003F99AF01